MDDEMRGEEDPESSDRPAAVTDASEPEAEAAEAEGHHDAEALFCEHPFEDGTDEDGAALLVSVATVSSKRCSLDASCRLGRTGRRVMPARLISPAALLEALAPCQPPQMFNSPTIVLPAAGVRGWAGPERRRRPASR